VHSHAAYYYLLCIQLNSKDTSTRMLRDFEVLIKVNEMRGVCLRIRRKQNPSFPCGSAFIPDFHPIADAEGGHAIAMSFSVIPELN